MVSVKRLFVLDAFPLSLFQESRTYWKQAMKQPHSTVTQSCNLMCCGGCGSSLFARFFDVCLRVRG